MVPKVMTDERMWFARMAPGALFVVIALLGALTPASLAQAQDSSSDDTVVVNAAQGQEVTAFVPTDEDLFGRGVSISGDTMVISALSDEDNREFQSGAAYVFVRDGDSWVQEAKLTSPDGSIDDRFGMSVAVSGDTIVVGASTGGDQGRNFGPGVAYVFVRDDTGWSEEATLEASAGENLHSFGWQVALSGDTVVVGANRIGYVFVRDDAGWSEEAQLTASDGGSNDSFGDAVSVSGDTIVIGASSADSEADAFDNFGAAYVFVRDDAGWSEEAKLTASDGEADDRFGNSVSVSGDTLVVAATGKNREAFTDNSGSGAAYVFVRDDVGWSEEARLTASDGTQGELFAFGVRVSGETVVVGSPGISGRDGQPVASPGSTYVFSRNGVDWNETAKLTASDSSRNEGFGGLVSISDDTIVATSYGTGIAEEGAEDEIGPGFAHVFEVDSLGAPNDAVDSASTVEATGVDDPVDVATDEIVDATDPVDVAAAESVNADEASSQPLIGIAVLLAVAVAGVLVLMIRRRQ